MTHENGGFMLGAAGRPAGGDLSAKVGFEKDARTMNRGPSRGGFVALGGIILALVLAGALCGCAKPDEPGYYIQRLGSDDDDVRRRAVEELGRMQKKALAEIKTTLAQKDPFPSINVRKGCVEVLGKIRSMESLIEVGKMLDDPDKDVRVQAIGSLSKLAQVWKKKSVELLTEAFEQQDPACVQKAGEGLRDMQYDEATNVLRAVGAKQAVLTLACDILKGTAAVATGMWLGLSYQMVGGMGLA